MRPTASAAQAPVPQAPNLSAPQGKVTPPPGAVDISQEPIVKIVANVQPAVVNINAEETVRQYYTVYDRYFQRYRVPRDRTAPRGRAMRARSTARNPAPTASSGPTSGCATAT